MLEFFYLCFIFPLEQFLGLILRGIYAQTQNGVLSVILLSLLTNLFLLKLLTWSDKKAEIETARKKRFDARIARWKSVYSKAKVFAFTQTLYKQNHYHPIFALSALGGLAIQVPFFLGVYCLIQNGNALPNVDFPSIAAMDSALGVHVLPILMTLITLANVFLSAKEIGARVQGAIIALLFLVLLYEMPHALVLYWTTNMAFSLCRSLFKAKAKTKTSENLPKPQESPKLKKDFSRYLKHSHRIVMALVFIGAFAFVFALIQDHDAASYETITKSVGIYFIFLGLIGFIYFLLLMRQKIIKHSFADFKGIIIFSILNIAFLICVFVPFELYSSDISQFHPSFTFKTLIGLIGAFLLVSFLMLYTFSLFKRKWFFAFLLSVVLVVGILNIFWLTGIYGLMDRFVFRTPVYSTPELFLWQNASNTLALFLAAAFVYFLFFKIKTIFKITLCTFILVSAFQAFQIFQIRFEEEIKYTNNAHYENELFSYSKTHKNIVVLVLDMFTGSHFPYLLQFFPELKTQLDGFVWFDNAVTSANATPYTLPSIIGGEYYTIINQNKRQQNREATSQKAYVDVGNAFVQAGYKTSFLSNLNTISPPKNPAFFWLDDNRALHRYFIQDNVDITFKDIHIFDIAHFLSFGIFKFAPDGIIRHTIYDNGKWFFTDPLIDNSQVINNISSFYAFTHIKNTEAEKPTFKFIHSLITHFPYGINAEGGKCNYLKDGSIFKDPPWAETYDVFGKKGDLNLNAQHFDTEACSLFLFNNFLEWLKAENIYDNTQILITSDHPGSDSTPNVPHLTPRLFGQDILFLFKDFGARGELQTDSRLMANFDAATIFCENLEKGCPNVAPNILKNYPQNRAILHARPTDPTANENPSLWRILRAYRIQGNLYDPDAYTDVSTEYATAGKFAKKH